MRPFDPRTRRRGFVARHPYFVLAVLLHGLVFGALYEIGSVTIDRAVEARNGARVEASLQQARRLQVQRSGQHLEDMQRRLEGATGAKPAEEGASGADDGKTPLQRAQALTERIEREEQTERAKELARLLKIPPEQALAKVKAEDAAQRAKQPPPPADPGSAAAQLEQRARQALERQAQRMARAEAGAPATLAHAGGDQGSGGKGKSSGSGQCGAGAHGRGAAGGEGRGQGAGNGDAKSLVDLALAGSPLRAEAGFADPRNYTRPEDLPRISAASVRAGRGRVLGRGGEFADRVYLDQWYVAGPFEARGPRSLQQAYPPEWGVDLDAVYRGKDGDLLHWVLVDSANYPFIPPDRAEDAIYYAWTEVRVDHDTPVWLDIGADDDSRLWVNDTLVWASGDQDKDWYHTPFYKLDERVAAYDLVEGRRRVVLHAGRNTLLFKLYNGIDLMFLSVVITP